MNTSIITKDNITLCVEYNAHMTSILITQTSEKYACVYETRKLAKALDCSDIAHVLQTLRKSELRIEDSGLTITYPGSRKVWIKIQLIDELSMFRDIQNMQSRVTNLELVIIPVVMISIGVFIGYLINRV